MRARHRGTYSLIAIIACVSPVSYADAMRCGDSIVQRGQTFFEVLERCGKPDLEYDWDHRYVPGVEAKVTEWVYELGTNKFRRVLRVEEGRLRKVELRPKPEVSLESIN